MLPIGRQELIVVGMITLMLWRPAISAALRPIVRPALARLWSHFSAIVEQLRRTLL